MNIYTVTAGTLFWYENQLFEVSSWCLNTMDGVYRIIRDKTNGTYRTMDYKTFWEAQTFNRGG